MISSSLKVDGQKVLFKRCPNILLKVGGILSVVIELIQYFTGWGIAELDDLFGNTLGGVIGVWGGVAMGYVQMAKYVERKNG